jgi:hypothetical protein
MSTVTLSVQTAARAGLTTTYTASGASPLLNVADTFIFQNTGKEYLLFQKTGATACVVTIDTPGTVDGLAVAQRTVTVGAGSGDAIATTPLVIAGPFPPATYNTPGTSMFSGFTLDNITGLSVRIIRVE